MEKVKILTDSCSDLNGELLKKYDIDYVHMRTVYQGKEEVASLTMTADEFHEMYNIMRDGNRITTTQVPAEEYITAFKKYTEEGYDIVYIGCSSKQSGSVGTANVIAKKIKEENKDAKIYCIDALNASIGEGMLAIEAAKLAKENKGAEEIYQRIMDMRNYVNEYVTVHSLDAMKRAGRVKASTAFFGNLMGVKPIITADADGEQTALKKVKGRGNSMAEVVKLMKENILDAENQTVFVVHADCNEAELGHMVELVKREINCKEVYPVYIGPIIGATIGPDAIGLFAFGKEVTLKAGEKN